MPVLHNTTENNTLWARLINGWLRALDWCTGSQPTCEVGEHEPSCVSDLRAMPAQDLRPGSYPTCDVGEHEPSWVAARRANRMHCLFYRLPEELMLQILGSLDNATKGVAQRTCGLFMTILFDPTLYSLHSRNYGFALGYYLVCPPPPRLMQPDWLLINRGRFCLDCLRFREDGRYEDAIQALRSPLWCSHCNKCHNRAAFSPRQRAVSSPATRVCVLAEGKARICRNESITYSSSWAEDLRCFPISQIAEPLQPICRHPDHRLPWYISRQRSQEGRCYPDAQTPSDGAPCIGKLYDSPQPGREQAIGSSATFLLFQIQRGTPLTRAFLQERLIANADTLGKMLCPHVTVDDGQLLLPFSPSCCACFDGVRWVHHPCKEQRMCCRCTAAKEPGRVGYFLEPCFLREHIYQCNVCDASYSWFRYGSAVTITVRVLGGTCNPNMPTERQHRFSRNRYWVSRLHPESWGIYEDEELHHVAWCRDIFCASRWRWNQLLRLLARCNTDILV